MSAIPIALAAALLAACGSSRPTDTATSEPQSEPADAGVSLGRPTVGGDHGPELPPTVVKSSVLETQRLTGNPHIEPDADDRKALAADRPQLATGKKSVMATAKLCVDGTGHVSTVKLLRSSGLPRYDEKILREIKTWTFRPVLADGQAAEVCSAMTFIYRYETQPPAPTPAPAPVP